MWYLKFSNCFIPLAAFCFILLLLRSCQRLKKIFNWIESAAACCTRKFRGRYIRQKQGANKQKTSHCPTCTAQRRRLISREIWMPFYYFLSKTIVSKTSGSILYAMVIKLILLHSIYSRTLNCRFCMYQQQYEQYPHVLAEFIGEMLCAVAPEQACPNCRVLARECEQARRRPPNEYWCIQFFNST